MDGRTATDRQILAHTNIKYHRQIDCWQILMKILLPNRHILTETPEMLLLYPFQCKTTPQTHTYKAHETIKGLSVKRTNYILQTIKQKTYQSKCSTYSYQNAIISYEILICKIFGFTSPVTNGCIFHVTLKKSSRNGTRTLSRPYQEP